MKNKNIGLIILVLLPFILSACGRTVTEVPNNPPALSVKGQTVADSRRALQKYNYPGLVVADNEATIVAKVAGNLTNLQIKVGDKVSLGQELARIDDVNLATISTTNFNAGQIKQAQILVATAQATYELAKTNYDNTLLSSVKDLKSTEIARDQALTSQGNLGITTAETIKSAELSYETAKMAANQASTTLAHRERLAQQATQDSSTNAGLTVNSALSIIGAVITNINNLAAFDDNNVVTINYRSNLGALDSGSYERAKTAYNAAKESYSNYHKQSIDLVTARVASVLVVAEQAKELTDQTKILMDKSITSSNLPSSSVSGQSLSGLHAAATTYQAQINAVLSQISIAQQTLINTSLNNDSLLDSLRQAKKIAEQQEAQAKQNLVNLKSGNISQRDQAGFSANLAQNQYENTKVKINSQVEGARTQMETARLQYNNAGVALQNLYDAHLLISPISGVVTKIFVAGGQTLSPGQAVITVSQSDNLKIQLFIEAERLIDIVPGLAVTVIADNQQLYSGVVSVVSPQADALTKRFLVEIKLNDKPRLFLGTVVSVQVEVKQEAGGTGRLILPLEAITIGQNDSYIFVDDKGFAKKINIIIEEVIGELAKIQVDLADEIVIVTEGSKLLREGQLIIINK